ALLHAQLPGRARVAALPGRPVAAGGGSRAGADHHWPHAFLWLSPGAWRLHGVGARRAHRRGDGARGVGARAPALAVRAGRPAGNGRTRLERRQRSRASCRSSERVGEHRPVMAIPVTLETLVGVVLSLEAQEVDELRVAGLDLAACGPAVIREVV